MRAGGMTDNHDVGGRGSDAPIPRKEHAFLPWEFRVEALREALTDPKRPRDLVERAQIERRAAELAAEHEHEH
jgi:hypothetical protein